MTDQGYAEPSRGADDRTRESIGRFVRFVWDQRASLVVTAVVIAAVVTPLTLYRRAQARSSVVGTVSLSFHGVDRHQYPNGRPFAPSEIVAPEVLEGVVTELGLEGRLTAEGLLGGIAIAPVIPADIVARWSLEERRGAEPSMYFPSQYQVSIRLSGLSDDEQISVLNAIVRNYRAQSKRQLWATELILSPALLPAGLFERVDYWEIPGVFERRLPTLRAAVGLLIVAAQGGDQVDRLMGVPSNRDARQVVSFQALGVEIDLFERGELQALAGYTFDVGLVKNQPLQLQRVQYQRRAAAMDLETQEEQVARLRQIMADVQRPQVFLQGPSGGLASTDGGPAVAGGLMEFAGYYGDLVAKISDAELEVAAVGGLIRQYDSEIERLQTVESVVEVPAAYGDLLARTESRFQSLLETYERLVDEYLDGTLTRFITMREGPVVVRPGRLARINLAGLILLVSVGGALLFVYLRRAVRAVFVRPQPGRRHG